MCLQNEKLDIPLNRKILEDRTHKITQFLVYLHTQETFLHKDLKKASLEKDESKIMTLGPYALVLTYILAKSKSDLNSFVVYVYRGMRITRN